MILRSKKFLAANKIVAFIKGNYNNPRCGYSNAVVQILQVHGAEDAVFVNILENHELMAKMKIYSDWLTYPQLYINGTLIGGYDIVLELHQSGEIIKILSEAGIKSKMSEHFKK
uniref:Glutaredoxin n=1 Tax=Myxobolus squamalis TaxID=59785 RepID=A0A6B2G9G8_MYXSQ